MNEKLQRIFQQALNNMGAFLLLGIVIACAIGLFILSYYLLLWGIMIGFVLWVLTLIRRYFSTNKTNLKKNQGRIIDHDQNK